MAPEHHIMVAKVYVLSRGRAVRYASRCSQNTGTRETQENNNKFCLSPPLLFYDLGLLSPLCKGGTWMRQTEAA